MIYFVWYIRIHADGPKYQILPEATFQVVQN
jgi:hypothetical protein